MRDYYEILGVAKGCEGDAIKAAFRKAAMECHPDRNPGCDKSESRFKECNEAYSVLSDPQKRAVPEEERRTPRQEKRAQTRAALLDAAASAVGDLMAVPKRKVSPSRRNMRRAHHALGPNAFVEDKETGELKRPHHVDLKTGMYKGRQVLTPKED